MSPSAGIPRRRVPGWLVLAVAMGLVAVAGLVIWFGPRR